MLERYRHTVHTYNIHNYLKKVTKIFKNQIDPWNIDVINAAFEWLEEPFGQAPFALFGSCSFHPQSESSS